MTVHAAEMFQMVDITRGEEEPPRHVVQFPVGSVRNIYSDRMYFFIKKNKR